MYLFPYVESETVRISVEFYGALNSYLSPSASTNAQVKYRFRRASFLLLVKVKCDRGEAERNYSAVNAILLRCYCVVTGLH